MPGRYPFGIALSPDEQRAYIANVGIYEYSHIFDKDGKLAKLHFPPYCVPSKEAEEGAEVEGLVAPPLGDPNDIRGMSVWTVDIRKRGREEVVSKVKTGHLVGEKLEDFPAVGGSSPNSIAATGKYVYVSNGSNDSISVIHANGKKREKDIDLKLDPHVDHLRGMIPFGVALSPDKNTLYVAEAGVNVIGVLIERPHGARPHSDGVVSSKLAVTGMGYDSSSRARRIGSGPMRAGAQSRIN